MQEKITNYNKIVQKNLKWNFTMHAIDGIIFNIGAYFAHQATIIPAFIKLLSGSDIYVGLIPTIAMLGMQLPQLFSAYFTESIKLKKRRVLIIGILGQRLPWFILGLMTLFLGKYNPKIILAVFFCLFIISALSSGIQVPIWTDFIAKTVPTKWRGRLFAIRGATAGFIFLGIGFVIAKVLEHFSFPINYSVCFLSFSFFSFLSVIFISLVKEAKSPVVKPKTTIKNYLKNILVILKTNSNFTLFIIVQVLASWIMVASAFYTVYSMHQFHITGTDIAFFTTLIVISAAFFQLGFGLLADKKGHMSVLYIAYVAGFISIILALLAANKIYFYLIFILFGIYMASKTISGFNLIMEFAPPTERPTYMAVANTIIAFTGFQPLLIGFLLKLKIINYTILFIFSAVFVFIGLLILFLKLKDPRTEQENVQYH